MWDGKYNRTQSTILEDGSVQTYLAAQMEEEENMKEYINPDLPRFPKTKAPQLYYEAYDEKPNKAQQPSVVSNVAYCNNCRGEFLLVLKIEGHKLCKLPH